MFSFMDGRGAIMKNIRCYQVCSILDKDTSPASCHHFAPDVLVSMRRGIFASFFLSRACQQGDYIHVDETYTRSSCITSGETFCCAAGCTRGYLDFHLDHSSLCYRINIRVCDVLEALNYRVCRSFSKAFENISNSSHSSTLDYNIT